MENPELKKRIDQCQNIYDKTYRLFVNQYGDYRADRLAASEVRRYLDKMKHMKAGN